MNLDVLLDFSVLTLGSSRFNQIASHQVTAVEDMLLGVTSSPNRSLMSARRWRCLVYMIMAQAEINPELAHSFLFFAAPAEDIHLL